MPYESMLAEMITLRGDNDDLVSAYTARPMGPGPFPGVVLIHHLPGWGEYYREMTRKFAHHGYAAISHNLYERVGLNMSTLDKTRDGITTLKNRLVVVASDLGSRHDKNRKQPAKRSTRQ